MKILLWQLYKNFFFVFFLERKEQSINLNDFFSKRLNVSFFKPCLY